MRDLHVRQFGTGTTPVLALHCGQGRGGMWRDVAEPLAARVTVTAPDLPGHGRSPPFQADEDVHDAATEAVLPLIEAPMHLWGHSFGATVALRLALEAPERVLSLTLAEPVFFAAAQDGPIRQAHSDAEAPIYAAQVAGDLMLSARLFNRLWGGGVKWDALRPQVQEMMAGQMGFVAGSGPSLWRDRAGMLTPGGLEGLNVPVTLLRGSESLPIIAEIHRGLMARIAGARETVVDGAGHMLVLTHAAQVADAAAQTMERA